MRPFLLLRAAALHWVTGSVLGCAHHRPPDLASAPESPRRWTDARGYTNHRVPVEGTTIHAIAYGGRGPAVMFLAGLGNTAHVFDDFAPALTDEYRVFAMTRRGYGESGRPDREYHTARLVEDLRVVLDSLGLTQVVLVGHSVGGDELTGFAVRYPDRVAGLVYLEAAYDRHGMTRRLAQRFVLHQLPPSAPRPRARDQASDSTFRDYLEAIYGVRWPLSEVRATQRFDDRGRQVGSSSQGITGLRLMRGEEPMRWTDVRPPVLAIYATDRSIERDYPWIRRMTIGRGFKQLDARRAMAAQQLFERGERRRLQRELPRARIVELRDASHYVFISHADTVTQELRAFLLQVTS